MDEYNLPIGGDITDLLNNLKITKSGLIDVNDQAKATSETIKKGFNESAKAVENSSKVVAQSATAYNTAERSLAELTDALVFYKEAQFGEKDLSKLRVYNQEIRKIQTEIQRLEKIGGSAYASQKGSIERATAALKLYQDMVTKTSNTAILNKYNLKIQETENNIKRMSNVGKVGFDELGNAVTKNTNYLTKGFSALRQIAYVLPGVGIAGILAFATEPIIKYISSLDLLKVKLTKVQLEQKAIGEALAGTEYAKAVQNVDELRIKFELAEKGVLSKDSVLKNYNETLGKTTGLATTFNEAEQLTIDKGDAYIRTTLLKAAAQIALQEASKKAYEAALISLKTDKESASFFDKLLGAFANAGGEGSVNANSVDPIQLVKQLGKKRREAEVAEKEKDRKQQLNIAKDFEKQAGDIARVKGINLDHDNDKLKKKEDAAEKKRLERARLLANKKLELENEIIKAEGEIVDKSYDQAVSTENAKYEVTKHTLEKQLKDFPELYKLINQAIEAETVAHFARLATLAKKNEDELKKIEIEGQKAISSVLKKDTEQQIEGINSKYDEIREKAKKANLLTAGVLKALAEQQAKDINDITLKIASDNLKKEEDLAVSRVEIRKRKEGQTEKNFEIKNQIEILNVKIKFQEAALKLFENDPSKELEANNIKILIENLKKQLLGLNLDLATDERFNVGKSIRKLLGMDDESLKKMGLDPGIVDQIVKSFSDLFNAIADSRIKALEKELDARDQSIKSLKDQIDQSQSELDRENDLKAKGYANNAGAKEKEVAKLKAQLDKEEADRKENIKRIQATQKIVAEIRSAELLAQGIEQTVNLTTAATKIFKATSGIPFIGVALALAAIATMVGTFLVIKGSIKSATAEKFEKGGTAKGKRHSDGGNKYVSMDGNDRDVIEIEAGEEIINRKSAAKHRKLLKAINAEDFSDIDLSNYSLREILDGTGVSTHREIAKRTGVDTIVKQNIFNIVNPSPQTDKDHLKNIEEGIAKLVTIEANKPVIYDMGDYLVVEKPNFRHKMHKVKKQ